MKNSNFLYACVLGILTILSASCKKTNGSSGTAGSINPTLPPNGNIVSTAAESSGTSASNNGPHGICADSEGNIYFSTDGATILKLNPLGLISTFAGSSTLGCEDGFGPTVTFTKPVSDPKKSI